MTGNKKTGIRDYALDANGAFPEGDRALQLRCADGRPGTSAPEAPLPPEQCPGNRRWVQIVFDAFLLQQGDTSAATTRGRRRSPTRTRRPSWARR